LWAWGNNENFATAQGTAAGSTNAPAQVGEDEDWAEVRGGNYFALAQKEDGTIYSWGFNSNGRTGLGTGSGNTQTPTQIGSDTDWVDFSPGGFHSMALKSDGTLWVWGSNQNGQLGSGSEGGQSNSPQQMGDADDWAIIGTGLSTSHAIKENGTLWGWGLNSSYQLGLGNNVNASSPTQFGDANT